MTTRTITEYVFDAYMNSKNHGFWDNYHTTLRILGLETPEGIDYRVMTKLAKIALMHSELGEGTEGVRKLAMDEHCPDFTSEEIELADAFIRICDYAGAFGLRLEKAIDAKMEYNKSRPYKHGKAA